MTKTTLQSGQYGLMGRPESGYSMKVLAAMRYKSAASMDGSIQSQ